MRTTARIGDAFNYSNDEWETADIDDLLRAFERCFADGEWSQAQNWLNRLQVRLSRARGT